MNVYFDRRLKSTGKAAILTSKQNIYGDTIEYDVQNEELHVIGNTRIEYEGNEIWGPQLRMKLDDSTGEMKNASFTMATQFANLPQIGVISAEDVLGQPADPKTLLSTTGERLNRQVDQSASAQFSRRNGDSRGDAELVVFEGQNRKRLKNARYTTCEAGSDDWYIKASELELDDYSKTATARNARIDFMGVPILYTPWISFSFLNQRKSGFLAPSIGTTSRSGFEVLTPYYWNIAPDMDATLGARYLGKRGLQLQGEHRYLGERYSGINNLEYLADDMQTGDTRFYARLNHQQNFGKGWSGNYNIERVSDDRYFSDLSTRIAVTSRVNLAQQGSLNYNSEVWNFNALVQKYQTLETEDGQSFFPYERLPQLTLTGNDDWGPVNTSLYTQFVAFDRDPGGASTITTLTGRQLTTNVTGNRFTAYPSISLPLARPYGYVTPKFGIHHTKYSLSDAAFNLDGVVSEYQSDSRTLPIFSVDSALYFERDVNVVKNSYTQTLEPRLYYVYIPFEDQSRLPVFDSALADLNLSTLFQENQFVGNDRINNANQLSLAVSTRMIDNKTGEQRLEAVLGQRFNFTDQRVVIPGELPRSGKNSDIIAAATLRLLTKWNLDTFYQYNTESSKTVRGNIGARYNPEPGKTLNLSYRFTQDRLEQINLSGQWPFGKGWYGVGRWNYSLRENRPIEGIAGVEYDAGCWQARTVLQRVSTATAEANYALFFQLELGGLASIGSSPLNLLSRSIPGYTSSGLISDALQQSYE